MRCARDSSRIFSAIDSATRAISCSVNAAASASRPSRACASVRASYSRAASRAASMFRRAPSNSTRRLSATAANRDAACSASKASRANRMASSSAAMSPISSKSASSEKKRDSSASGLCLFAPRAASSSASAAARNAARLSRGFLESSSSSRSSEVPSSTKASTSSREARFVESPSAVNLSPTTDSFSDVRLDRASREDFFSRLFFRPALECARGKDASGDVGRTAATTSSKSVCAEDSASVALAARSDSVPGVSSGGVSSASAGATGRRDWNRRRAYVDSTPRGSRGYRDTLGGSAARALL